MMMMIQKNGKQKEEERLLFDLKRGIIKVLTFSN